MTSINWLHLTDLHRGMKEHPTLWPNLEDAFFEDLKEMHEETGPWDIIFFSGDLVQSGSSEEFSNLNVLLERLHAHLNKLGSDPILLTIPGNHDLLRPKKSPVSKLLLSWENHPDVQEEFWRDADSEYRQLVNDVFANYVAWQTTSPFRRPEEKNYNCGILPGDFSATFEKEGYRLGIVGLNSTFLQLAGGDFTRKLCLSTAQLSAVCGEYVSDWLKSHDFNVLMTHQPPHWLFPASEDTLAGEIALPGRFVAHFYGHMHEHRLYITSEGGAAVRRHLQGCSLFGLEYYGDSAKQIRKHGYSAGQFILNDDVGELRYLCREATQQQAKHWELREHTSSAKDKKREKAFYVFKLNRLHSSHQSHPETSTPSTAPKAVSSDNFGLRPDASVPITQRAPKIMLPRVPYFFGRDEEREQILQALNPDIRTWGVVIEGPGGIGKTSLALWAADQAPLEHFPLKVFISAKSRELTPSGEQPLSHLQVTGYEDLLSDVCKFLGQKELLELESTERTKALLNVLAEHQVLLVIDNVENFQKVEHKLLATFLSQLPWPCKAIVTNRPHMDMSGATRISLPDLEIESGLKLIEQLAKSNQHLQKSSKDQRVQLHEIANGNPLLIHWMVGQLGRPGSHCRTINDATQYLRQAPINNDPLEYIFGDLIGSSTLVEEAAITALVHFSKPTTIRHVALLAQLTDVATECALRDLVDRSIIGEDEKYQKFYLPQLVKMFLGRSAKHKTSIAKKAILLTDYIFAFTSDHSEESFENFAHLEKEWFSIEAGTKIISQQVNDYYSLQRLQTVWLNLDSFLIASSRWDFLLDLTQQIELNAEKYGNLNTAGWAVAKQSWIFGLRSQTENVLECIDRCQKYWKDDCGLDEEAHMLKMRSIMYTSQGDFAEAQKWQEKYLELVRQERPMSSETVSIALDDLALLKRRKGDFKGALIDFTSAQNLIRNSGNAYAESVILGHLADLAIDMEDWLKAEKLLYEAISLDGQNQDSRADKISGHNCLRLARALVGQGRKKEALPYAQRAVEFMIQLKITDKLILAQNALEQCGDSENPN